MKILFSCFAPPLIGFGGGALTAATIIKGLRALGHDVSILWLANEHYSEEKALEIDRNLSEKGQTCVHVRMPELDVRPNIVSKIWWRLNGAAHLVRPWASVSGSVSSVVEELNPDLCFLYSWEAFEAFETVTKVKKVGFFGQSRDKLIKVRIATAKRIGKPYSLKMEIDHRLHARLLRKEHARQLSLLDGPATFCANEAVEWSQELKNKEVCYFPNLVLDDADGSRDIVSPDFSKQPYTVLHIGHMKGSATQDGLSWLVSGIIPELRKMGVLQQFSFKFVGKFQPPDWLITGLEGVNHEFLGFVEDFVGTVQSAHVAIVPIHKDSGNRTRVASVWALSGCVVAHNTTSWGMPEVVHDENSLLAETAKEYAEMMVKACTDENLNLRLRKSGREAYEKYYEPRRSMSDISVFLGKIIQ